MTDWEERVLRAAHPVAYPATRALRRWPVARVPGVGAVVSDAVIAQDVLVDTEHFSLKGPGAPSELWAPILGPSVLLNVEGLEHGALRRALGSIFEPAAVKSLTAADDGIMAETFGGLSERLMAGRRVDLVDVTGILVGTVICRMAGLAPSETAVRAAMRYAEAMAGTVRLRHGSLAWSQVARSRELLDRLANRARAAYREGGDTVPGRMRELGLSEREAMSAVGTFVLAGTETVQSFVPRFLAIAHDTGWLDRVLLSAGDLRRRAIDEGLRVTVPALAMVRSVRAETTVADLRVRPGDRVVIAALNCCRAAGDFDPDRPMAPAVRGLWFGGGPRQCLGAPLAIAEVEVVLDALAPVLRAGRRLRVTGRAAARGVLIPAYRTLAMTAV